MKRVFFFLLLLFTAGLLIPETLIFRSNSMGMTLEKISRYREDEFDFILSVEKLSDKEVRILLEKGEEVKRWERTVQPDGVKEIFYSLGELDTVTVSNTRGDLLEEVIYNEGIPGRTIAYIYENYLLSEIIESDNDEAVISISTFLRSSAGRMQRVVQSFPSHEPRVSAYTYSSDGIIQEWHATGDRGDLFRFNSYGETITEEIWDGDDLNILRRFTYGEGGGYRLVEEDYSRGVTIRKMYDQNDQLRREFTTEKGNLVDDTIYYYEEETLIEKVKKLPGIKDRWQYEYDSENNVNMQVYSRNGKLKKITHYTGDDSFYEELFRNGTPFIRIYYEEERKVREETL